MLKKMGRPTKLPSRTGTFHCSGSYANRMWLYKESLQYGLTMSDIFNEMIESIRLNRKYNPARVYKAQVAYRNPRDLMDDGEYEMMLEQRDNAIEFAQQVIDKEDIRMREIQAGASHTG